MGMVIYLRRASPTDIARLTADPAGWDEFVFEDDPGPCGLIDFDKAWHALHFMLTGSIYNGDSPLALIACDGERFGADANGFGGFSVVPPEQMAQFQAALADLSDEQLAARYDPAAMFAADIYLADVFEDEGAEALDYVMQGVPALRQFANLCARDGSGALRVLS